MVDVNPIAMSNAFSFIKDMPEDGLVVMLDIGALSSTLVVYGKGEQFFTRDLPIGGHHFVKELSEKKEIGYTEAQDQLFRVYNSTGARDSRRNGSWINNI